MTISFNVVILNKSHIFTKTLYHINNGNLITSSSICFHKTIKFNI